MNIKLTFDQIKAFARELEEVGRTEFLVKHRAIRVLEDGSWAILHFEGLKLGLIEAFPGVTYENDVPYTLWQEVLRQVYYFLYKKEQKEKEKEKLLQKHE